MPKVTPILKSSPVITKYSGNPFLTKNDMPYEADCIFNAGFAKYQGKYVCVFRNDYGFGKPKFSTWFTGINLGFADSDDGLHWNVRKDFFITNEEAREMGYQRFYDPRLTVIDGELYMCCAVDRWQGICGGVFKIHDDLKTYDLISVCEPDCRNFALFPEKIGGLYTRFDRPMANSTKCSNVWISQSPDLKFWGNHKVVLETKNVPWVNHKIGPAAPPIKTEKGWLATFHAVDHEAGRGKNGWEPEWDLRYTAGIMLLDLEDPSKIIGMSCEPLIAPEEVYETDEGFRQNVIFPGGMILEDSGEVKIYYGASDDVECLATAHVDDLIKLCLEGNK